MYDFCAIFFLGLVSAQASVAAGTHISAGAVASAKVVVVPSSTPSVPLFNAAVPGTRYPAYGLGTGGYGTSSKRKYPECWAEVFGCGENTVSAVKAFLAAGGRRIDGADSYFNQKSVGQAMRESGVPRSEIFLTTKVGPTDPLGYNDTMEQWRTIKTKMQIEYADLILIHWPTGAGVNIPSKDPLCQIKAPTYDERACRISTWRALVEIFKAGGAKAIGVSNFNSTHIQELADAGLPLPALNQCPFNPYRGSSQMDTVKWCQAHNITFNGYSPLGIPDLAVDAPKSSSLILHKYPSPMRPSILQEPALQAMAKKYNRSEAVVLQNWAWSYGIPTNARSNDPEHMRENLNAFDFKMDDVDRATLLAMPQDYCSIDKGFYECAPGGK